MRLIHTADIHYDAQHQKEALESLEFLLGYGKGLRGGLDLWILAGDLFNRAVLNSESAGLARLVHVIRRMLDLAPIVAVQGTITHDVPGCYEILQEIMARHPFVLLSPDQPYYLNDPDGGSRLMVLGCEEPRKDWFLANRSGLSREAATQAIENGMRQLLLGLGAKRSEHTDIPCVFVYHGSVAGASMCNGQQMPGTDIRIGREDLSLVGADYVALGHIHLAQQISDLHAYYAGSAYPVNWGETDRKSFNDIYIQHPGQAPVVTHIPYPHQPRLKIRAEAAVAAGTGEIVLDTELHDLTDMQVWLEISAGKDVAGRIDQDRMLAALHEAGAADGSRVSIDLRPVETVRAGEIRAAATLTEKLRIYANNSDEELSDGVAEKAEELEAAAQREGLASAGLHIRIRKLGLRGAIGIVKGTGRDEIVLDLDQYDPGLIALLGPNGAGKTTLIENLHPFPTMLTRPGSLQQHFCLKDSWRDLYFTDVRTGDEYRAYIQIDPTLATPKAEYHLYRNGAPITNGRRDEYEKAITRLFGSLGLYVRSAFVSQKPPKGHPDLADATPAEKKALFRELGGLDYLETYAEMAKERARAVEGELQGLEGKIEVLERAAAALPERQQELEDFMRRGGVAEAKRDRLLEEGRKLKQEVEELAQQVAENARIQAEIAAVERRRDAVKDEIETLEKAIKQAENAQKQHDSAQREIEHWEELQKRREELEREKTAHLEKQAQLDAEWRDRMQAHQKALEKLQNMVSQIEKTAGALRTQKAVIIDKIDGLEERISQPLDEHCPTCGQLLPEDTRHDLIRKREQEMGLRDRLQDQVLEIDNELNSLAKDLAELNQNRPEPPAAPELPPFAHQKALDEVLEAEKGLDALAKKTLSAAQEAALRIKEAEIRIASLVEEAKTATLKVQQLSGRLHEKAENLHQEKKQLLDEKREAYTQAERELAALQASIADVETNLRSLQQQVTELEQAKHNRARMQSDHRDWLYLQRACGKDGIQALELDAMGPSITEIANRLLGAAYGSRFRLEIRTTRIAGKGSKTKQVEDFQIVVHDARDGTEQTLDTLSGGETVWVRKAIYDAFSVIRAQSTGTRFLTSFLDEADGALDPAARQRYFDLVLAAHDEAGRHHTIVVTHSEVAQQAIAQHIDMRELATASSEEVHDAA